MSVGSPGVNADDVGDNLSDVAGMVQTHTSLV